MGNLLFTHNGFVDRGAFHKGAVVLLAINFFLWPVWFAGMGPGFIAFFASLVLVYCWACLFIKRLRAAGKSSLWFLTIFSAFAFGSYILGSIFLSILSPEMVDEIVEFQKTADPKNPDMDVFLPFYDRLFKALAIPYAAAYLITGAALAFSINRNLPANQI